MGMKAGNAKENNYYLGRFYGPPGWGAPEPGVAYTLPVPGQNVSFQGVRSRPELNGATGVISSEADDEGYVRVRLTDRSFVKVLLKNMLPFGKAPKQAAIPA